ncbi:MAG: anthranilate synthase component I [Rickettsiales bacterium]|nr:anthranilate synthase component I [Rickettsiales bacterium]
MIIKELEKNIFLENYLSKNNQIFFKKISSDLFTPVSLLQKFSYQKYFSLFESVTGGEKRGRFSILAFMPDKIWICKDGKVFEGNEQENFSLKLIETNKKNIFSSLRSFYNQSKIDKKCFYNLPSSASGLFGFIGYDMVKYMEDLPDEKPSEIDIPDALYYRPKISIVIDNILDVAYICTPVFYDEKIPAENAYNSANERILEIISEIQKPLEIKKNQPKISDEKFSYSANINQAEYAKLVQKAIEYIKAGDIFQVVASRRFNCDFNLPPESFYRSLRSINPSPYLFYLKLDDFVISGSSPEILVKLENEIVTIRPIAGTRKRGVTKQQDLELEQDLLQDEKEIAEHLMLLDLGRNDVGKVAQKGSVVVTEKMFVEKYSHVMHIVSNVEGKIAENKDFLDCLIAGFPAGTTSGAPKIRAMEIIDELEPCKRQFYAGTIGYFSSNGDMDTCIALRTALLKDNKIFIQSGGGIVYDSTEEGEFLETENKAKALLKAVENAKNYI